MHKTTNKGKSFLVFELQNTSVCPLSSNAQCSSFTSSHLLNLSTGRSALPPENIFR